MKNLAGISKYLSATYLRRMQWGLVTLLSAFTFNVQATTAELQTAMRTATFEVVMKKPEKDPLTYEKPLPLELLPYMERTDKYRSVGTAFSLGHNTYVTAGHVLNVGVNSELGHLRCVMPMARCMRLIKLSSIPLTKTLRCSRW